MASSPEPTSRRTRPAKAPLSRQGIVDAALSLIRELGVDSVTLRHVATQLDTGPASLYAYFESRDALLEHVLDAAYGQVSLVDAEEGRDWRAALAATIVNMIESLQSYPGLGAVALGTIPVLPGALRLAEHELALMDAGGVAEDRAALAVDLIAQFAAATALENNVRLSRKDGTRTQVRAAYQNADPERFPRVARSAAALTGPDEQSRRDFSIGVFLTGIDPQSRPAAG